MRALIAKRDSRDVNPHSINTDALLAQRDDSRSRSLHSKNTKALLARRELLEGLEPTLEYHKDVEDPKKMI
jgi:hypothetical protein